MKNKLRIELNGKANAEQVFAALDLVGNAGSNVYVQWERECKVRKSAPVGTVVTKLVTAPVRYGIAYGNLLVVKQGIEAGLREEVQPLPFGDWRKGYVNRIIDYPAKNAEYCRLSPASFKNMVRSTEYTLNGKPATYEEVVPFMLASEYRTDETPLVFLIKPANFQAVGCMDEDAILA